MSEISVKKLTHPVQVKVDADGKPYCFCGCGGLMVEVEPGSFMCPDWAFMHVLQAEWARALAGALTAGAGTGAPLGLLAVANGAAWGPIESGPGLLWPGECRAVRRDAYVASVDWDSALRQMGQASTR